MRPLASTKVGVNETGLLTWRAGTIRDAECAMRSAESELHVSRSFSFRIGSDRSPSSSRSHKHAQRARMLPNNNLRGPGPRPEWAIHLLGLICVDSPAYRERIGAECGLRNCDGSVPRSPGTTTGVLGLCHSALQFAHAPFPGIRFRTKWCSCFETNLKGRVIHERP